MSRNHRLIGQVALLGLMSVMAVQCLRAGEGTLSHSVTQLRKEFQAEQRNRDLFVAGTLNDRTRAAITKGLSLYGSKLTELLSEQTGELESDNFRCASPFAAVVARSGKLLDPVEMPTSPACVTARQQVVSAWDDVCSKLCGPDTLSTELIARFRRAIETWEHRLAPHWNDVKPGHRTKLREHVQLLKGLSKQLSSQAGVSRIQFLVGCQILTFDGTVAGLTAFVLENRLEVIHGSAAQKWLAKLNHEISEVAQQQHERQLIAARETAEIRIAHASVSRLASKPTALASRPTNNTSFRFSSYRAGGYSGAPTYGYSVPYATYHTSHFPVTHSYRIYTTRTVRVR